MKKILLTAVIINMLSSLCLSTILHAQATAGTGATGAGGTPPPIRRHDTFLYEQAQITPPPISNAAAGSGGAIGGLGSIALAGLATLGMVALVAGDDAASSGTN